MADMLNLLIAKGGVSEMEPTWGSQEYQKGALDIQTKGLQNELARQQLAAEPEKQKMQDTLMKLRELGVTIREHAAKLEKSVTIPLNFNGEDYDLTAPSAVHIGKLGEAIEKDPSILSRKDIMTQLGAAGFSIKKSKEEKESPYGAAAIEAARQKDLNKAKIDQQFGTGGKQTVDDQALAAYLASNPGKTAADYIKWKEKQTYAPQVELYEKPESGETLEVNVRDPEAIAKANASGFNAMSPERKAYTSKIGTENAVTESKMVTEAKVARGQITTLQTLDQLADRFETGKMAGVKMSLQQYAAAFGLPINLENLSSKEAFNALTQQLALQSRNQGEGMVLAGQMSDRQETLTTQTILFICGYSLLDSSCE